MSYRMRNDPKIDGNDARNISHRIWRRCAPNVQAGLEQAVIHLVRFLHHHGQQVEEHAEPEEGDLHGFVHAEQGDEGGQEGGDGHGAHGLGDRVDQVVHPAEAAHQQAQRNGDDHAERNAWAMRHQLWKTLPSKSYSVQRRTNAGITPMGWAGKTAAGCPNG